MVISVCGMLCGSDGPTAIHRCGAENRRISLEQLSSLPNGIPSAIAFVDCWMRSSLRRSRSASKTGLLDCIQTDDISPDLLIAIDGKTCRRSHDASQELGALHIVSAWASEEGIALGQVATEEKSNEITAIPLLLKQIDLPNSVITIDAMGCQKEIA